MVKNADGSYEEHRVDLRTGQTYYTSEEDESLEERKTKAAQKNEVRTANPAVIKTSQANADEKQKANADKNPTAQSASANAEKALSGNNNNNKKMKISENETEAKSEEIKQAADAANAQQEAASAKCTQQDNATNEVIDLEKEDEPQPKRDDGDKPPIEDYVKKMLADYEEENEPYAEGEEPFVRDDEVSNNDFAWGELLRVFKLLEIEVQCELAKEPFEANKNGDARKNVLHI